MATFTTRALVLAQVGPYLATADIADAEVDAFLIDESGRMADRMAGVFYTFNSTTDTPATPQYIQELALAQCVARVFEEIAGLGNDQARAAAERKRDRAMAMEDELIANPHRLAPETKSGESVTFGSADSLDWTLPEDEAFLASTSPIAAGDPPSILVDTVRITAGSGLTGLTNMRLGHEFSVLYRPERVDTVWVLKAHDSRLWDGTVTGLQVSYKWTYRRMVGATAETYAPTLRVRF